MLEQSSSALVCAAPRQNVSYAESNLQCADEFGTLILDGFGKILSCGGPAERIFGARQSELVGRWISQFFDCFRQVQHSARHLVQLYADGNWREANIKDAAGFESRVKLHVSRQMTDGREIFLITLCRSADATRH